MTSLSPRRPQVLTPAMVDYAASSSVFSPLDQLGLNMHDVATPPASATKPDMPADHAPPIPTLDFNLFRSPSIYSVDSSYDDGASDYMDEGYGFGFVSEPEEGIDSDSTEDGVVKVPRILTNLLQLEETAEDSKSSSSSPTTPQACRIGSGDSISTAGASPSGSRTLTPTRDDTLGSSGSGSVRRGPASYPSLPTFPYQPAALRSAIFDAPFSLQPVPVRTSRSMSGPPLPELNIAQAVRVCSDPVPQPAPVAALPQHTAVAETASIHGEQGSDWGEDENGFEWLDRENAPEAKNGMLRKPSLLRAGSKRLNRLRNVIPLGPTSPEHEVAPSAPAAAPRQKKKRPIVIPRRAAPPPPSSAPFVPTEALLRSLSPSSKQSSHRNTPSPEETQLLTPDASESRILPSLVVIGSSRPQKQRSNPLLRSMSQTSASPSTSRTRIDEHSNAPGAIPRGRYDTVPHKDASSSRGAVASPGVPRRGSAGNVDDQCSRPSNQRGSGARSASPTASPSIVSMNVQGRTPSEIVAAGFARRTAGDLPKAAYLFMKAAEAGSITGQIHWALALRHGAGIARDDRRAFSELLNACDRSLSESGIDLRAAGNMTILSSQQQRLIARDTNVGLIELGNCYLDGVGVKRNPDRGLEYLRMAGAMGDLGAQEHLGHILSKGASGIKKDNREAAKWYRAALAGGSNIPGLAWVWKDKYNEH